MPSIGLESEREREAGRICTTSPAKLKPASFSFGAAGSTAGLIWSRFGSVRRTRRPQQFWLT